jgi:hypothetical protein
LIRRETSTEPTSKNNQKDLVDFSGPLVKLDGRGGFDEEKS